MTDNLGEYTSAVIVDMLDTRDIKHVPIVAHNSEENGVAVWFNLTIMNAIRTALITTKMMCSYWSWALADATDKYNQLPHASTENSPHEACFDATQPHLSNLYELGQLGYL